MDILDDFDEIRDEIDVLSGHYDVTDEEIDAVHSSLSSSHSQPQTRRTMTLDEYEERNISFQQNMEEIGDLFRRQLALRSSRKKQSYTLISSSNHVFMSEMMQTKPDPKTWISLPDEILLIIFSYLSLTHLSLVMLTCSKFKAVGADWSLWLPFLRSKQCAFVLNRERTNSELRPFRQEGEGEGEPFSLSMPNIDLLYNENLWNFSSAHDWYSCASRVNSDHLIDSYLERVCLSAARRRLDRFRSKVVDFDDIYFPILSGTHVRRLLKFPESSPLRHTHVIAVCATSIYWIDLRGNRHHCCSNNDSVNHSSSSSIFAYIDSPREIRRVPPGSRLGSSHTFETRSWDMSADGSLLFTMDQFRLKIWDATAKGVLDSSISETSPLKNPFVSKKMVLPIRRLDAFGRSSPLSVVRCVGDSHLILLNENRSGHILDNSGNLVGRCELNKPWLEILGDGDSFLFVLTEDAKFQVWKLSPNESSSSNTSLMSLSLFSEFDLHVSDNYLNHLRISNFSWLSTLFVVSHEVSSDAFAMMMSGCGVGDEKDSHPSGGCRLIHVGIANKVHLFLIHHHHHKITQFPSILRRDWFKFAAKLVRDAFVSPSVFDSIPGISFSRTSFFSNFPVMGLDTHSSAARICHPSDIPLPKIYALQSCLDDFHSNWQSLRTWQAKKESTVTDVLNINQWLWLVVTSSELCALDLRKDCPLKKFDTTKVPSPEAVKQLFDSLAVTSNSDIAQAKKKRDIATSHHTRTVVEEPPKQESVKSAKIRISQERQEKKKKVQRSRNQQKKDRLRDISQSRRGKGGYD